MDSLRKPFFILAVILSVVIVLIDIGAAAVLRGPAQAAGDIAGAVKGIANEIPELAEIMEDVDMGEIEDMSESEDPPGIAIPYLALVDASLLFTLLLMTVSLFTSQQTHATAQGCVTAIYSLLVILAAIALIILAVLLLILMVTLLLAVPFGTLAYLAIYGFFNRGGAAAVLGLLMVLKVGVGASLIAAQQRFLQNKGLVLLALSTLLCSAIVSLLHGIVPGILVSITDAIGAIINGICGLIWAVVLLIGAIPAILKAVKGLGGAATG